MSDTESGKGVSRRDFLRTAGKRAAKDAVETGTKLMPGGAIVRQFLAAETQETVAGPLEEGPETEPSKPSLKRDPLSWLAAWRAKRDNPSR